MAPSPSFLEKYMKDRLVYDGSTGLFTWTKGQKKGEIAGWKHHSGYVCINLNYTQYSAHRLAWLYTYGYLPKEIDHKDRDKANNKISNLRSVTRSEN